MDIAQTLGGQTLPPGGLLVVDLGALGDNQRIQLWQTILNASNGKVLSYSVTENPPSTP